MSDDVRTLLLRLDDAPPVAAPAAAVRRRLRRRQASTVVAAAAAVVAVVAASVLVVSRPGARRDDDPAATVVSTGTETVGVRMELTVEPRDVRLGDLVTATVRVTNTRDHEIEWESNACHHLTETTVTVGVLDVPGPEWTGVAARFKQRAMRDPAGRTGRFDQVGVGTSCPDVYRLNPLPAGASRTAVLQWRAAMPDGGAPDGTVTVTSRFPMPGGGPDDPNDPAVSVRLRLTGEATFGREEAVDIALSDARFLAWLERQRPQTWWYVVVNHHRGEWEVGLHQRTTRTDRSGRVTIDPERRTVVARRLPAAPF